MLDTKLLLGYTDVRPLLERTLDLGKPRLDISAAYLPGPYYSKRIWLLEEMAEAGVGGCYTCYLSRCEHSQQSLYSIRQSWSASS